MYQPRLRTLIDEHFDFVWRMVRRLGMSDADADDIVQEVFVVLARKLDRVEAYRERAFLIATALRTVSSFRRSTRRRREDTLPSLDQCLAAGLDPEQASELASARPLLQEALQSMPIELRVVFVLYEIEELEVQAIAELLGAPRGTISWRLKMARQAFAEAAKKLQAREAFTVGSRRHGP